MTIEPGVYVAVGLFLVAQAISAIGAWWKQNTRITALEAKYELIEKEHKSEISAIVTGHTALREIVSGIQIEIARGFTRLEEQIKTLFRDQEKHT